MKTASVSELKANLSRFLREVRRGGEVQILDRGTPVARLVGPASSASHDDARRDRLIRAGLLRAGTGDASAILSAPPLAVSSSLADALEADRADRL